MGKLNLVKISTDSYNALATKDKETIYWLSDGTIYAGGSLYGGKVALVTSEPESPELNTLYIDSTSKKIQVYDGSSLKTISNGYTEDLTAALSEDGDSSLAPTAQAIYNYLEENYKKDLVVTSGKYIAYEEDDEWKYEIWLSIAEKDAEDPYANSDEVIKIPVGSLVDIYTGDTTNTIAVEVDSDNKIKADLKVSAAEGNILSVKEDGLYATTTTVDVSGKADKVGANHTDEVALYDEEGNLKAEGYKIGGSTFATTVDNLTLATEEAAKAYADSVVTWVNWETV
jgi:hypothetical protein